MVQSLGRQCLLITMLTTSHPACVRTTGFMIKNCMLLKMIVSKHASWSSYCSFALRDHTECILDVPRVKMKLSMTVCIYARHTVFFTFNQSVPDLPVCVDQRNVAQCCSTQFIQQRQNLAEQNFINGLRMELQERFQDFENLTNALRTCKQT